MGLFEVLHHLPRLLGVRRAVVDAFRADPPDVFVGIDAPEFNLNLAPRLRRAGIPTVQYVSPQVWAWRQGRVNGIAAAVDLVLCLLPFEAAFYARHAVRAEFVGHPLADQIPLQVDRAAARVQLGLPEAACVVALLPGSRLGEVSRLGDVFAGAARLLAGRAAPGTQPLFIAPMASAAVGAVFAQQVASQGANVRLLDGQSRLALTAADAVLVASGTATLETLLHRRPMVVAYRVAPLTAWVLRGLGLVKVRYCSQPNLLSDEPLVPEFIQEAVTPEALADALVQQLQAGPQHDHQQQVFADIHVQLRQDGARRAAQAVAGLLRAHGLGP
jgi:lipid-A-disaccharide synthase